MKVDRIIPNGKTRSRVLFDEGLVLMLYNSELDKHHIFEGADITEETYEKTLLPLLTKRAKERLVLILKSSDKPEAELRRKLKEGCYPDRAIDETIAWAKNKHYVDDARYIETYLRYHAEGRSRRKLMYDLQARGLDRNHITNMLDEMEVDEDSQIEAELARRHYTHDMDPKEKQKIIAALTRKGYSWSAIASHIRTD